MTKISLWTVCGALALLGTACDQASGAPKLEDPAKTTAAADAPADNTKRNVRERDNAEPTPMDQGNNETDLKITQEIRKAVMADDALSTNAKNAKIISQNGVVTLKGPVATDGERKSIEDKAKSIANVKSVENQLEITK